MVVKPHLIAIKAPKPLTIVEALDTAVGVLDRVKTRNNLETIANGLAGITMDQECIGGVAELLSGGQYTAPALCLNDDECARELQRTLGL